MHKNNDIFKKLKGLKILSFQQKNTQRCVLQQGTQEQNQMEVTQCY